jgi:hypothetical protein
MTVRLAIVGSTKFADDPEAKDWAAHYIQWVLQKYYPEVVISGGAIGIDQLAATLAAFEDIEVIEHLPVTKDWPGYKARNILIAQDCTHLLAIRHSQSTTYGSGWTADYAEKLGKKVYRKVR